MRAAPQLDDAFDLPAVRAAREHQRRRSVTADPRQGPAPERRFTWHSHDAGPPENGRLARYLLAAHLRAQGQLQQAAYGVD